MILVKKFFHWYEKNYQLNLAITTGLFALQIFHLIWLTTSVVWERLFGYELLHLGPLFERIVILVDYTEIPALASTTLLYVNDLRKKFSWKTVWFIFSLNIQLLHMFWITDEFVVEQFASPLQTSALLAWMAILIDYLELPVIADTVGRLIKEIRNGTFNAALAKSESVDLNSR